mgnify:FL=1|jgi:hypothetical protein|nr:MAG TPA: hypothetical protein [Caudoviricetes sp.]
MKVRIFSAEGYAGLGRVSFPVEVEGHREEWCGEDVVMVSEKELERIGAEAYQTEPGLFYPSKTEGLYFSVYEVL